MLTVLAQETEPDGSSSVAALFSLGSLIKMVRLCMYYTFMVSLVMVVMTSLVVFVLYWKYARPVVKTMKSKDPPPDFCGTHSAKQLAQSICIDIAGVYFSFFPGMGIIWAPCQAAAMYLTYGTFTATVTGLLEATVPVLGAAPLATITWFRENKLLVLQWVAFFQSGRPIATAYPVIDRERKNLKIALFGPNSRAALQERPRSPDLQGADESDEPQQPRERQPHDSQGSDESDEPREPRERRPHDSPEPRREPGRPAAPGSQ